MMKNKHSIYLHRVGAIGDTLLTSNLLVHLKSCYKEPRISMGTIPNYALPLLKSGLISDNLSKVLGQSPPSIDFCLDEIKKKIKQ